MNFSYCVCVVVCPEFLSDELITYLRFTSPVAQWPLEIGASNPTIKKWDWMDGCVRMVQSKYRLKSNGD